MKSDVPIIAAVTVGVFAVVSAGIGLVNAQEPADGTLGSVCEVIDADPGYVCHPEEGPSTSTTSPATTLESLPPTTDSSPPSTHEHTTTTTTLPPTTTTQPPTTTTTQPPASCWPNATPMGALPGQPAPVFCTPLVPGPETIVQGTNSWVDDFQHGHSFADIGSGYRTFTSPNGGINQVKYWRHADHWMVDVNGRDQNGGAPWNNGGTWMRPNRSFRFENGKLVVEMDVAAGVSQYGGAAWPELVVSTAGVPNSNPVDHLYAYGYFRGNDTVGVRLDRKYPITAYYPASGPRQYEAPPHLELGGTVDSSQWTSAAQSAWRTCVGNDPDTNCRDRFRWEITRTAITLYVNGVKFQGITNLPPLADAMMNGNVYVYAASWLYRPNYDTVRFHWDRFAVNP